jgi:hypothetical protein
VTGVTGSDGAATIRLRSGNYTLRSNAPGFAQNPQPPTSPQRFSLSKDGRGLRAIGFWTLFIVFWWALSGIYFAWYRQVTSAVAVVSPLQGMLSPVVPTQPKPGPDRASLE